MVNVTDSTIAFSDESAANPMRFAGWIDRITGTFVLTDMPTQGSSQWSEHLKCVPGAQRF
jgi:hypothetical protein